MRVILLPLKMSSFLAFGGSVEEYAEAHVFVLQKLRQTETQKILNCCENFPYLIRGERILRLPKEDSMRLGVTIQDLGETAIVRCVGRIGVGETETFRNAVLSQSSRRTVGLDLARLDAIDCAGIGVLVFLHGWAQSLGVDLQLINPTQHVRELLELTNLDSVFKILSSEETVWSPQTSVSATGDTAAYQSD